MIQNSLIIESEVRVDVLFSVFGLLLLLLDCILLEDKNRIF